MKVVLPKQRWLNSGVTGTQEGASSYALWTGVSKGTGPYDETFTLSPTHSCMISFGAASCSLMTTSYHCYCLLSPIPICIGIVCSPARSMLDLSLDTYLYHRSQLPCTESTQYKYQLGGICTAKLNLLSKQQRSILVLRLLGQTELVSSGNRCHSCPYQPFYRTSIRRHI